MNTDTTNAPSVLKLIGKLIMAVGLTYILVWGGLIAVFVGCFSFQHYPFTVDDSVYEYWYESGNISFLLDELNWTGFYGEDYEMFYEAIDAENLRCQYLQWSEAERQGIEGAGEAARDCLIKLETLAQNSQYPENQTRFTEMLSRLTQE